MAWSSFPRPAPASSTSRPISCVCSVCTAWVSDVSVANVMFRVHCQTEALDSASSLATGAVNASLSIPSYAANGHALLSPHAGFSKARQHPPDKRMPSFLRFAHLRLLFSPLQTGGMGAKKGGSSSGGGGKGGRPQPFFTEVDPAIIYFSHARIRTTFSGCGRKVEDTLAEIMEGRLKPEALPFITVMLDRATGTYCSLNNRRLWVFKECKKRGLLEHIRVRVRTEESRYSAETCALEAKVCLK